MTDHPNKLRDYIVACAVRDRRIAPEEAEDYRRMYDAAPVRVADMLVPDRSALTAAASSAPVQEAYPASWLGAGRATGSIALDR